MTDPIPDPAQSVRLAVECLTLYVAADSQETRAEASDYIAGRLSGPDALDPIHLVRGQLYLNEIVLLALAKASGAQAEDYRPWAGNWLRDFSAKLPE